MANEFISVGKSIPKVARARPAERRCVEVTWDSGKTEIVNLAPALESHRRYVRLRTDDILYNTLRVGEFGDSIVWDDGAELSALWIEELADEEFSNDQFREAMAILDMSLDGMAVRLGVARRLIAGYRKDKPIPKNIALATRYLLAQRC